ncbi:diguanylate cyclase [Moritella sp. Urea-trap-13]|uniref:diguanylate cyclase n=1 Tax=Moritella sp. Urea-trap-13 TaxID=2058327 RepID=UPI000C34E2E0|nr:diguanylate cyclase [Moritella sp. Urea-trap-13]PKH06618.1 hypothetical protein CXF93_11985 [Moritella sp. Urea-trap-13]
MIALYIIIARFGGEEFLVVLPYLELEQATRVASRVDDLLYQAKAQGRAEIGLKIVLCSLTDTKGINALALPVQYIVHLVFYELDLCNIKYNSTKR